MEFTNDSDIDISRLTSTAAVMSADREARGIVLSVMRTLNLLLMLGQLPSFVLYVLFLIVIVRNRKELASSFYDMSVCVGVVDISYAVFSTNVMVLAITSPTALHQASPTMKKILAYSFLFAMNGTIIAQYSSIILLSVNRFTALVYPLKYKQLWNGKRRLALAVLLQWLPSVLPVFLYRLIPSEPGEFKGILKLGFVLEPEANRVSHLWDAVHLTLAAVVVILLYAGMSVAMFRHRRAKQTQVTVNGSKLAWGSTSMRRERKLAFVGLVLGGCTVYLAVVHAFAYFEAVTGAPLLSAYNDEVFSQSGHAVHTIFTYLNPYLVLAISDSFRGHFRQFIRCG